MAVALGWRQRARERSGNGMRYRQTIYLIGGEVLCGESRQEGLDTIEMGKEVAVMVRDGAELYIVPLLSISHIVVRAEER